MPHPPLKATRQAARAFLRRALLLDSPAPDVAAALDHLGFVQVDPINVCGRMHDLILRNRVSGYREGALHAHIHSRGRPGLEHYHPGAGVLVALPFDAWPHVSARAHRRRSSAQGYSGRLSAAEERLARRILAEIAERGPLTSDDIEDDSRAITAWGTHGRRVKTVLEKLFAHARVLISERRRFRRVYDLPERVLPPSAASAEPAAPEATARWVVEARLRQRRLVILKKHEVRLVEDLVQRVEVEDCPPLYCLKTDVPLFEDAARGQVAKVDLHNAGQFLQPDPLLLAPLDPLIYDRRLARSLWDFDYIWEAYTPPAKRKRGYFALPVLSGTDIVGYVDPKADRKGKKLAIVSRKVRRGHKLSPAVRELSEFLGFDVKGKGSGCKS
jgi:hypothetical protein